MSASRERRAAGLSLARRGTSQGLVRPLVLLGALLLVQHASAQTLTVRATGAALRVEAQDLRILAGPVLPRLKDGRSMRLEFELMVMPRRGGPSKAHVRSEVVVSFDLWEERFALTTADAPPRSTLQREAARAEAWCLEQLSVPLQALGGLGRDAPLWVRLRYRIRDAAASSNRAPSGGFTLGGLIDRLSRRADVDEVEKSIDAGPFRVSY